MLTASRHSRAEISIRSWARARPRLSSRGQEEQGGEWYQTSCPLNMWPGLLPTRNHSSTGLHWMLALGSQPLVPPAPKSDTAWSYFLWTLEPRDAIWQQLLFATQPQITALPWMMQSHGTQGHPPPYFPPPALSPTSGLWTTKDTAQATNSLSRRWQGLSAIAIPFQQPCLLLGEATHKILELQ